MRDFEIVGESAETRSLSALIGEGSRFFAGHFPGRPILPAIAHLTLVDELLRRTFGEDAFITSIERLRVAQPALPGDLLEIRLVPDGADPTRSARFTISRGGALLSEGLLGWAREEP